MTAGGCNTSCLSLTSVGYKVPVCRNVTQALLTHMLLRLHAKQMAVLLQVGAGWYVMYVRMHRQGKGRRVGEREDGGGGAEIGGREERVEEGLGLRSARGREGVDRVVSLWVACQASMLGPASDGGHAAA
jgi:hypothetical protein